MRINSERVVEKRSLWKKSKDALVAFSMPRQRVGSDVARTLKVRFKNLEWDYYDLSVHYVSSFQKYIFVMRVVSSANCLCSPTSFSRTLAAPYQILLRVVFVNSKAFAFPLRRFPSLWTLFPRFACSRRIALASFAQCQWSPTSPLSPPLIRSSTVPPHRWPSATSRPWQ